MADSDILGTQDVLCDELDAIERRRQRRGCVTAGTTQSDLETHGERAGRMQLSALCLSGGGIRSAAFCLGALQTLAAKRLLRQFDFLSTVSAGGFIVACLQVLIRQAGVVGNARTRSPGRDRMRCGGSAPTRIT